MKFVSEIKRTHYCGDLNAKHEGQEVVVMGWVNVRRDHGGLIFIDLRDRTGLVQIVLNPKETAMSVAKDIRNEFVIAAKGVVKKRPQGMINSKLSTGEIEVVCTESDILSKAKTPPFEISDANVSENLRLKYRYLDLRSENLQHNLIVRHKFCQLVRRSLSDQGFLEIETPILYKSTPEGARDYLVPSRVSQGKFYALPQSPQTLKQLLMISGMDRYFQIARCFRDEDLRADRQPEFTQVDIEMSFCDVEDILAVNEKLVRDVWKGIKGVEVAKIPRITYQEAMNRFGNDKPDTRFGMELKELNSIVKGSGFKVFEDAVQRGDFVKGIAVPKGGEFPRSQFDKLTKIAQQMGAKGLVWIKNSGAEWASPIAKFVSEDKLKEIFHATGAKAGDAALIVADNFNVTCAALAHIRVTLGHELKLIDTSKDAFLWVLDFPLLEYDAENKRWAARHHPFTSPQNQHMDTMLKGEEKEYGNILAKAYDLVCNGYEIGGGSIRIHREELQKAMFRTLGLTEEEVINKFGYFNEALQYGTPPHGGVAWGVDRVVMILCGTDAIRDVIAFPKTAKASDLMSETPSEVSQEQLLELGIRLGPSAEKALRESRGEKE